ncbi:Uncharacterized protein conserved in bacteria [Anaerobiospirillum thomasii]|uniref:Macrodomain Ori protein n=1 Tax=Anaerobiospirillum thomasii TaxID=179995 RepID=A0A2X0WWA9_9GAMM|nr:DUF413 domain-containing protein [Anaerobiospirillum thomasii]SPT68289.1 Uncharacterized protein conserved in bacteria [Anaerobiospirillum thomasii]SPT70782.1 Uncharacterized protein conserved in bacteria [Anaerobiospirillum thomasii]
MSFESEKLFNDFQHFARGIRRSGEFSIRESTILEQCGTAMMELHQGIRQPADETEKVFLEQLHGSNVITDPNAKVFKKYLQVIQPRRLHRLCSVGAEDEMGGDFGSSSDDSSID